jgi:acetyltransferase-like isoleucine patch superfamily enzyme
MSDEKKYFVHERAVVETDQIGEGTRIWGNAHVMKNVRIGKNCNIGEGCFVESGVVIGDRVVVKNNIAIWEGVTVEDDAFLGPNVVFTNDMEPRAGHPKELAHTLIKRGASLGANSTIVANTTIGEFATVGAGSVVTRDVPPHRLVFGNPARIKGWMCVCGRKLNTDEAVIKCSCGRKYSLDNQQLQDLG